MRRRRRQPVLTLGGIPIATAVATHPVVRDALITADTARAGSPATIVTERALGRGRLPVA